MKNILVFILSIGLLFCSCSKREESSLLQRWLGKEIIFPINMIYTIVKEDTVEYMQNDDAKYKILTYIDGGNCVGCKLQFQNWNVFMNKIDSLTNGIVPLYTVIHSPNVSDIEYVLWNNRYNRPIYVDLYDSLNLLNHFEQDQVFQTFLLNTSNQVILIGNPLYNSEIEQMYLSILEDSLDIEIRQSTVSSGGGLIYSPPALDLGSFNWKETQCRTISVFNRTTIPIVIESLETSCECLTVMIDETVINPNEKVEIYCYFKADNPEEMFLREIFVQTNEPHYYLLNVVGNAIVEN